MGFDEEVDEVILLLLVATGITNLLGILPKSRRYNADQQKLFITTLCWN